MKIKRMTNKDHIYKNPTVNADAFDKRRFNELLHMSKGLQKIKHEGRNEPFFDQLMGDIWSSFFKNNPKLLNKEEISPDLSKNYQLMERILNDKEFHESHEYTKLDDLHSVLCTVGFAQKVFEWMKKQLSANPDMYQSYKNMKQQQREFGEQSQEYQKALSEYLKTSGKYLKDDLPEFSQMLQDSIKETKTIEEDLTDLIGGIKAGTGSQKELKQMPLRDQFTLAEYLKQNHKMKQIAKWAGRFKAIAKSKQKSISKESIARSGVTIGNDIDRILPNELITISNPASRLDFLRRFAEGQTLQFATKGKQSLGKGSIILCLDQSGSMRNLDNQSKGFALALMSIAKRQKRDFALITFDEQSITREYPKGKITTKQMIDLCENFMGGGTDFQNPLSQSLQLIKNSKFKNADIIFVTDGEANLNSKFLGQFQKEKQKFGFSVLSLLIGNNASDKVVKDFSDEIYYAKDFKDENAHEVFAI